MSDNHDGGDSALDAARRRASRLGLAGAFFATGAAGLIFELSWLRLFVNVFGYTTYSTGAVLAAFMGGMGAGGLVFGRMADRSAEPLRLFGKLAVGAGAAGLAVPIVTWGLVPLYRAVFNAAPDSIWLLMAVKLVLSAATISIPAALMGGTLPVLVRVFCLQDQGGGNPGRETASLYAVNTAGAVAGVLAAGFWLIPAAGLFVTSAIAAAVYIAIGAAVLRGALWTPADPTAIADEEPPAAPEIRHHRDGSTTVLAVSSACGFAAFSCEITWTRLLVFVTESTVYALTVMLATFLAGLALGSAIARRALRRGAGAEKLLAAAAAGASLSIILSCALFAVYPAVAGDIQGIVGMSWGLAMIQRLLLSAAVMLPATVCFGAAFPAAAAALASRRGGQGAPVGTLVAWNTAGAVAGSLGAGLLMASFLGSAGTLVAASAILLLAAAVAAGTAPGATRRSRRVMHVAALAAGMALVEFTPGDIFAEFFNIAEPTSQLIHASEGPGGVVAVHHYPSRGVRLVSINGVNVAGTAYELRSTQRLQAALPLALHGSPAEVLQVGYGSGETSRVLVSAGVRRVSVVEINPQIISVSARFFSVVNGNVERHERFRPIVMDGANLIRLTNEKFDLIMNDSIWPHLPGCSGLYTREYFAEAKERLAPGGIMTSWLPLELSDEAFPTVLATFTSAFEHATLWSLSADQTKHALIVGSDAPLRLDLSEIAARIERFGLRDELAAIGIASSEELLGTFLVGEDGLRKLAAGATTNSRDRPVLEFMTSRRRSTDPRERMAAALGRISRALESASTLTPDASPQVRSRLDAMAAARRRSIAVTTRRLAESARAAPVGMRGDDALTGGDPAKAAAIYREALAIAPDDWKIHLRLAHALAASGDLGGALARYRRTTELRPNEAEAWGNMAVLLLGRGERDEAKAAFGRLMQLDPWSEETVRKTMPHLFDEVGR